MGSYAGMEGTYKEIQFILTRISEIAQVCVCVCGFPFTTREKYIIVCVWQISLLRKARFYLSLHNFSLV